MFYAYQEKKNHQTFDYQTVHEENPGVNCCAFRNRLLKILSLYTHPYVIRNHDFSL